MSSSIWKLKGLCTIEMVILSKWKSNILRRRKRERISLINSLYQNWIFVGQKRKSHPIRILLQHHEYRKAFSNLLLHAHLVYQITLCKDLEELQDKVLRSELNRIHLLHVALSTNQLSQSTTVTNQVLPNCILRDQGMKSIY